jgi:hypothetical protein
MKLNQTFRQFILLSAISLAVAAGTNAARAAGPTATLTVTINGRGSVSPTYKGKALDIGTNYTIKATAAAGFAFSDWTVVGSTNTSSLTNAKLTFQMVSNLQLTANFVDIQPPTMTITTKKSTGSNSVVEISGTAKDNVGVAAVWCQVGSNGWNLAETGNEYTNWTAFVILSEGANTIQVYAEDAAGNRSKTNSVTLTDDSIGLVAPESLAGTMLELASSNGSAVLSFNAGTFSQMGSGQAVTGVGIYTYTLSDPDTGQLATTFTAPPTTVSNSGGGEVFILSFTNGTSGTWSNLYTNSGTFTLSDASSTAPDSLSGLTVQGAETGTNHFQFTNEYGDGTFTAATTTGNSSGTYTFAQYSPVAGLLQESFTDEADLGTTNYMMLDFLTGSNTFYSGSYTANSTNTGLGPFSVTGETSTEGYTAPASLNGLTGAATGVNNGTRVSHMFSFGAVTYGDFSAGTNHANKEVSDVGTYTYTRTGPKTALIQTIDFAPPEEAGTNTPVVLTFTSSHSATYTNSDGGHTTITFSEPAATVPLSLVGRTLTGHPSKGTGGAYSFGYGTFSGTGGARGQAGTYTYVPYGPQVAMSILTFTDANDAGTTQYLELWFSSATGGSYDCNDFTADGLFNSLTTGTFTMK